MSTELVKGGTTLLVPASTDGVPAITGLVLELAWESGAEVDATALACGSDRRVVDDQHFVFFNNPVSPDRALWVRTAGRRAQVLVDLVSLSERVERIVVSVATLGQGTTLADVSSLTLTVFDPARGEDLVRFAAGDDVASETCLVVAELYRHSTGWKLRAVGQGYASGLIGLGHDYGIDLVS